MTCSPTGITLTLGIIVASARPIGCQQLTRLEAGVQRAGYASIADNRLSGFSLSARSVGWSAFGSLLGGAAVLEVDPVYCRRRHGDEQGCLFGPCFLYANVGFAAGCFVGAM